MQLGQPVITVVWFLLGVGFLLALPVLLDFSVWIPLAIFAVAVVLALPIAAIVRALRDRHDGDVQHFRTCVVF